MPLWDSSLKSIFLHFYAQKHFLRIPISRSRKVSTPLLQDLEVMPQFIVAYEHEIYIHGHKY